MPNVLAGHAARRAGKPLIISARGMLAKAALSFSPLKKRIFWHVLQRDAVADAAAWHATSADEAENLRAFGIKAPIAIIPNGIDIPCQAPAPPPDDRVQTLLFLSRIHPKKGLVNLLTAWSRVAPQRQDWYLVIAGPDEGGHQDQLKSYVRTNRIPRVDFPGPVYGPEKTALLATVDLFVLPTLNENFGIAVAEALANGIPAIVTKGAPWAGLQSERCGWWIEHGVEPLTAALLEATALPDAARQELGRRGRAWMERDFSWEAVASQMLELYTWVVGAGDRPSFISRI